MRNSSGPRFDSVLVHVKKIAQFCPPLLVLLGVAGLSACSVFDPAGHNGASPPASPSASSSVRMSAPPAMPSSRAKAKLPARKPKVVAPMTPRAAAPSSPAPRFGGACTRADLTVSLGAGSNAAGSAFQQIVFTNTSKVTCTLSGYPGAALTSAKSSATQLGDAAGRNPVTPHTVILKPGQTASSLLRITYPANFPQDQGHIVPSAFLQVYVPGQGAPVYVPDVVQGTTVTSVPLLQVSPVVADESGPA